MIVDTMSLQEVGETILKTAIKNIPRIKGMVRSKERTYKRIIYKGLKDMYDFQPLQFEADGINYHLCPYSIGKSDYKKYGMLYTLFAHFYYNGTNWYCTITNNFKSVSIYCNHFFERYIERHLKDDSSVNPEIVRKFFNETDHLHYNRLIENPKHPNCIYSSSRIGVCCGYRVSKNILAFMTYIDKDTLTLGDKKESYDIGLKALDSVYMNEKGELQFGIIA